MLIGPASAPPPVVLPGGSPAAPFTPIVATRIVWWRGAVVGLLLAAYLVMSEIDRLVAQVLDGAGRSWSFAALTSPGTLWDISGWKAQGFTTDRGGLYTWMFVYMLVDLVFIACYTLILYWLLGKVWPVIALAAFDTLEDLVAVVYGRPSSLPDVVATFLATLNVVKWLAVAVVVAVILQRLVDAGPAGTAWRATLKRLRRALYIHRFSLIPLVPVTVLGLVSGANLFDQLPDIQRQWVDSPGGAWQAVCATLVLVLLAGGLFVLGRLRSEYALERATEGPPGGAGPGRPDPVLWIYLVGPALVGLGVVLNGFEGIQLKRLFPFVGVPLLVFGLSWWWRAKGLRGDRPQRRGLDLEDVPLIALTGDVLAVLAVVVGGLALVRSFTAGVVLGSVIPGRTPAVLLIAGVAVCTVGWWLVITMLNLAMEHIAWLRPQLTVGDKTAFGAPIQRVFLGLWLGVFLALNLFPLAAARLGVIACVLLALTSLSLLMGSCVVVTQDGGAPDVLWRLGARAAPLSLLLLGAVLLGTLWSGDTAIHGTRNLTTEPVPAGSTGNAAAQPVPARDTLSVAFDAWAKAPGCRIQDGSVTLRPMFLLAAEGGGIRAAYWTAAALDRIVQKAPCAASSGLIASGASGGAVGLTVARFAAPGTSSEQVERIADPSALAAGSVGLFVRDLIFPATGVPAPPWGSAEVLDKLRATGNGRWADRAALIEAVWQTQAPALDTSFLAADGADEHPTGQLVLNSTSVGTGCRMLVSQVEYSDTPPGTDCAKVGQPVAGSLDLFGVYPSPASSATRDVDQHCVGPVLSSTAAMFASRFPFVTPSGVIGPCAEHVPDTDQLVDGGYVENTGIGTLLDLSPEWMRLVREENSKQLRTSDTPTIIVPTLVYLDNGTGSDLRPPTSKLTEEPLVPLVASQRAGHQQSDTSTLLQRAVTLLAPTNLWDPGACLSPGRAGAPATNKQAAAPPMCARLPLVERAIHDRRPYAAVVVHESTFPSIAAPLGWTLSQDSINTMNQALDEQTFHTCATNPGDLLCDRGYGSLADLFTTLVEATPR